jgi:hypothetical protein
VTARQELVFFLVTALAALVLILLAGQNGG